MFELETIGYVLWESFILLTVLVSGIGLVALRRKAHGRPGFTTEDRQLFFGCSRVRPFTPRMLLKLTGAAALCFCSLSLEAALFVSFGAALLTGIMLVTSMAIVAKVVY